MADWYMMNNMTLIIIITTLIILVLRVLFKLPKTTKSKGLKIPPGSNGWPIIGENIQFLRASNQGTIGDFVIDRMKKYNTQDFNLWGDICCAGRAGREQVVVQQRE
ncbi:hypothetical protein CASFOL_000658 [Castilleja foliolosa]|uniref:Cytochrome P450 n=1 Tax=Castilleja foliolosa TaxID=1961234 RepID=A0ABD3EKB7_9LAMI